MKTQPEIIITDDHALYRNTIKKGLEEHGIVTIAEAGDGVELIELLHYKKPDVVLLDLEMPVMNGNVAFNLIKENYPEVKVIILSTFASDGLVDNYIKRKANGFLPKDLICPDLSNLADAINEVHKSDYYFLRRDELQTRFTNKEAEVIEELCDGKGNKAISKHLHVLKKQLRITKKIFTRKQVQKLLRNFLNTLLKAALNF